MKKKYMFGLLCIMFLLISCGNENNNSITSLESSSMEETKQVEIRNDVETNETESIKKVFEKDWFYINETDDFIGLIHNNAIDAFYSTNESIESYYDNRAKWYEQAQFTLSLLKDVVDQDVYNDLVSAVSSWDSYYSSQLSFNQSIFYVGKEYGDSMSYLQTAVISDELTKEMAITLLSYEYELTEKVQNLTIEIVSDTSNTAEAGCFEYQNTCISLENDFYSMIEDDAQFNNKSQEELTNMIIEYQQRIAEYSLDANLEALEQQVESWMNYIECLKNVELQITSGKEDLVEHIYLSRMKQLAIRLYAIVYQMEIDP